jgi:hypothetical protein
MSAWRRVALEKLPEYRKIIDAANEVMACWLELNFEFDKVYRSEILDRNKIRRFYEFARWCLANPSTSASAEFDPLTAAVVVFFEHIPRNRAAREDLHNWISRKEFLELQDAFRYLASESEFAELESSFKKSK